MFIAAETMPPFFSSSAVGAYVGMMRPQRVERISVCLDACAAFGAGSLSVFRMRQGANGTKIDPGALPDEGGAGGRLPCPIATEQVAINDTTSVRMRF